MADDSSGLVRSDTHALSVVLVVGDLRIRAEECLRTILRQESADSIEVLLFDVAKPTAKAVAGSDHPSVRVISLPPETAFATARAEGVRRARAPYVAFLRSIAGFRRGGSMLSWLRMRRLGRGLGGGAQWESRDSLERDNCVDDLRGLGAACRTG
jgi:hypothetical protein